MDVIPTELPDCAHAEQPIRNLWASVILQALADTQVQAERGSARYWLHSAHCREICELLGIDHGRLARRAR